MQIIQTNTRTNSKTEESLKGVRTQKKKNSLKAFPLKMTLV